MFGALGVFTLVSVTHINSTWSSWGCMKLIRVLHNQTRLPSAGINSKLELCPYSNTSLAVLLSRTAYLQVMTFTCKTTESFDAGLSIFRSPKKR